MNLSIPSFVHESQEPHEDPMISRRVMVLTAAVHVMDQSANLLLAATLPQQAPETSVAADRYGKVQKVSNLMFEGGWTQYGKERAAHMNRDAAVPVYDAPAGHVITTPDSQPSSSLLDEPVKISQKQIDEMLQEKDAADSLVAPTPVVISPFAQPAIAALTDPNAFEDAHKQLLNEEFEREHQQLLTDEQQSALDAQAEVEDEKLRQAQARADFIARTRAEVAKLAELRKEEQDANFAETLNNY